MLKAIWILIRYFYINDHTSIKLQTVEAIPNSSRSLLLFKCEEVAGSNVGSDMNKIFLWNDVIIGDLLAMHYTSWGKNYQNHLLNQNKLAVKNMSKSKCTQTNRQIYKRRKYCNKLMKGIWTLSLATTGDY